MSTPAGRPETVAKRASRVLIIRGLVVFVIGIVVIAWPDVTVRIAALILGSLLISSGLMEAIGAFDARHDRDRTWRLIHAALTMLVGIIAVAWPGVTVRALAILLGLQLMVAGSISATASVRFRKYDPEWTSRLARGLFAFIAGLIAVSWPGITVLALVVVLGIHWMLGGLMALAGGARLRRLANFREN